MTRDPTPGTFENEYRREFWQRVAEANHRFRDSTLPGWKTDRGKVFIVLGEPESIESNEEGLGSRSSGARGVERWWYKRAHTKIANPEFVVVFYRDQSLDWRLSSDPTLSSAYYNSASMDLGTRAFQEPSPTDSIVRDAALMANFDLGVEMAVPSNTELVIATVSAREVLSLFEAQPVFEYFRAKDGSTFVNIGALLNAAQLYGDRKEGSSDLRLHASLLRVADTGGPLYASNEKSPQRYDLAEGAPPGGLVAVWTGIAVPPGHYTVTIAVEESLDGRLGRGSADIEVPDYSKSELTMSTAVIASSIAQAAGRMGVTVRPSKVFRRSEMFGLYYEVYGLGGTKGGMKFQATYRFYRMTEDGTAPIGRPIEYPDRTEAVQTWSTPLEGWPPGRYVLQIDVEASTGDSASTTTSFEVVE